MFPPLYRLRYPFHSWIVTRMPDRAVAVATKLFPHFQQLRNYYDNIDTAYWCCCCYRCCSKYFYWNLLQNKTTVCDGASGCNCWDGGRSSAAAVDELNYDWRQGVNSRRGSHRELDLWILVCTFVTVVRGGFLSAGNYVCGCRSNEHHSTQSGRQWRWLSASQRCAIR